ncbi:pyridoxal phosphate-dependent transferase [Cladorrhinum sp. PSN332]|nr:pyridoxal phosphate-dependent transferase [Cladorrhinum sp. PSN332]
MSRKENIPPHSSTPTIKSKPLINLLRGWPNPSLLPVDQLKKAANKALSDPEVWVPGLEYAPDPGYEPLRTSLAVWTVQIEKEEGIRPEEICITGGASQNLACLLASFADVGVTRAVWMAAPCYYLACPIFEDAGFGNKMRAVPEDEEGVDVKALEALLEEFDKGDDVGEHKAIKSPLPHRKHYRHLVYLVPTCSNPSGKTMGLKRRQDLVALARAFDALIICDDVYDFLQWPVLDSPNPPSPSSPSEHDDPVPLIKAILLPRLSDIDASLGPSRYDPPGKIFGHAISNGSFSKIAGPGTRTGWTHGTPDFVLGLSQTGATRSGGAASQLAATMLNEMLVNGDLDRWLSEVVRPGLQRRHAVLVKIIKEELGGLGCEIVNQEREEKVFGGYFVWVKLPEGVKAKEVAERAKSEENLVIAEGPLFEVAGDEDAAGFGGYLRLSFSWEEEEKMVEGVKRLGRVLRVMLVGDQGVEKRTEIVGLGEVGNGGSNKRGKGICYGQVY